MKRKCDRCNRPATHHSVQVDKDQKIEKHLCDLHAAEENLTIKAVQTPISELLTNFVKLHSGESQAAGGIGDMTCQQCGMSYAKFREHSLLGCPDCYKVFERPLSSLLERAHEGGSHHIGKVPARAGAVEHRQTQLLRMRKRLDLAVADEDYELAARIRDDLQSFEECEQ